MYTKHFVKNTGLTDADDSDILKYITATTMTNSECAVIYVDAILEGMVCTSAGSDPFKSTCFVSVAIIIGVGGELTNRTL